MSIVYRYGNNLYINLTNRCPCSCVFCVRDSTPKLGDADSLWLKEEPSPAEILTELKRYDMDKVGQIVFCGYGEPTERLGVMLEVAAYLRKRDSNIKLRVNTNGLGDLINGRSIAAELCRALDIISVSLNAGTKEEYMKVTRPKFPDAFEAMQKFTADCVKEGSAKVMMSIVDVIPPEQIEASRAICEKLGATLRIRELVK